MEATIPHIETIRTTLTVSDHAIEIRQIAGEVQYYLLFARLSMNLVGRVSGYYAYFTKCFHVILTEKVSIVYSIRGQDERLPDFSSTDKAFCSARVEKYRTSASPSFFCCSKTGIIFCFTNSLPSGVSPNEVPKTSKALATLKRMLGMGSTASCNRGAMISV